MAQAVSEGVNELKTEALKVRDGGFLVAQLDLVHLGGSAIDRQWRY